jgi:hypothetical protein
MQKNKNRQGLALGAIFSLVAGIFVGAPAAQASTANNLTIVPSAGTSLVGLVTDDFALQVTLDPSVATTVGYSKLKYQITHASAWNVLATTSNTATVAALAANVDTASVAVVSQSPLTKVVTPSPAAGAAKNTLAIRLATGSASIPTSVSAEVAVTVVAFIDNVVEDGALSSGEWSVSTVVTLKPWSALAGSVTLTAPQAGDVWATASAAVSGVNLDQLDGNFELAFRSTNDGRTGYNSSSASDLAISFAKAGTMSSSKAIASASSSPVASISAVLYYDRGADNAGDDEQIAIQTLGVGSPSIDGLTFSPVASTNIVRTAAGTADARVNSTFAVTAKPFTGSGTTVAVASNLNWSTSTELSTTKYLVVNGVTHTSSATIPTTASPLVLAAGSNTVTIQAVGFSGDEVITLQLNAQNKTTAVYRVTLKSPAFVLTNNGDYDSYSAALGESVALSYTVEDQFGLDSARTNQRVAASVVLGGSTSETVSAVVSGGQVALTVAPVPATRTGSATVTLTLQAQNIDTGLWENVSGGTDTVNINVSSVANAFVSRTASVSASISRVALFSGYSWSGTVTTTVANSYSFVVVSAPGLVIEHVDSGDTASGTITVQADGAKQAQFKFAGTAAGTHTVTFTNGSATTTSQVIISAATGEEGRTVVIAASSSALPQQSIDVTVTVTDEFGNPVDTATASQLTLTANGAGFFSNGLRSQTAVTDATGKATFTLTSGANDSGALILAATYDGTVDATSSSTITIAPAPVATADKVTVVASAATVQAGRNADVTITVTDTDGKAHAYKTVVVYSTGAGYLSAQTVTTDGDGKAVVKLITGANESGTATITASVGGKSGTATVTVLAPVVVTPPVVVVPEVSAVIGTFNGRWAVRVENAKGSVVTVKVGGKWFKGTALNNSYTFSGRSKVGATPLVKVWVDGELQNEQTITIK